MTRDANPRTTGEIVGGRVRRVPKYPVFLVLGGVLGVVAAAILTMVFNGADDPSHYTEVAYSRMQVFGFVTLVCVPVGVMLGGIVALILDRTVGRRTREVTVGRETVRHLDE